MPSWKRILLRSAGFGAGFALTLCIVVGVLIWYIDRPRPPEPSKPWDTRTIQAEYDGTTEEHTSDIGFRYVLKNNGTEDYRISDSNSVQISFRVGNDGKLAFSNKIMSIETPVFIPAGQKAIVLLTMRTGTRFQHQLPEHATDAEREQYRKEVVDYLNGTLLVGFALFDEVPRIEIEFPSGWKKAQSQK
jgi:hypothetical protein